MMKKSLIVASLLFATTSALANDTTGKTHIGISHDGNMIVIGHDIQKNFRMEAFTSQYKQDTPKDEFTSYGIGAFYTKSTGDKTSIYGGLRFGHQKTEDDSGNIVMATFGFEYFLDSKVSLGAEASYYDRGLNDRKGIDTSINIKYYF